jgi:hypothetical protein
MRRYPVAWIDQHRRDLVLRLSPFKHRVDHEPDRAALVAVETRAATVLDDIGEVTLMELAVVRAGEGVQQFGLLRRRLELGHDLICNQVDIRELIEVG